MMRQGDDRETEYSAPSTAHGSALLLPALFLLCHIAAILLAGRHAPVASQFILTLIPLAAALACFRRAYSDAAGLWVALGSGMVCWAGGMAAALGGTLLPGDPRFEAASMLLYVLYGVPLIFALASPEGDAWQVRLIDGALALMLGYLFHLYVHGLTMQSDGVVALRRMFDVENGYIAAFALVRLLVADAAQRPFLRALSIYAVLYLATAAYINHFESDADYGGWPDLVIGLPFLVVIACAQLPQRRGGVAIRRIPMLARIVTAGSPLMTMASLLTVSVMLIGRDPTYAVAGCIVATLGFGVRTVLVQFLGQTERERLEGLIHRDALTGVANRRAFDMMLDRECTRRRRHGGDLAVLMIDIDHFKALNDHYGHAIGDARLRDVARGLAECARRGSDFVARYGGEEFAMILTGTGRDDAMIVATRVRSHIEHLRLSTPAAPGVVTISIGVAVTGAGAGPPVTDADLLSDADRALYEAKRDGRNRVAMAAAHDAVATVDSGRTIAY